MIIYQKTQSNRKKFEGFPVQLLEWQPDFNSVVKALSQFVKYDEPCVVVNCNGEWTIYTKGEEDVSCNKQKEV